MSGIEPEWDQGHDKLHKYVVQTSMSGSRIVPVTLLSLACVDIWGILNGMKKPKLGLQMSYLGLML